MSTFIDLDSIYRNREQYPMPTNYLITDHQMSSWFIQARQVRAFPQEVPQRQMEFVTTIKLLHFVLPYQEDIIAQPIIFIDLHTQKYNDKALVSTISNTHPQIKFVAEYDKVQNDFAGDPIWIHYKCNMSQVMRFSRKSPLTFQVTFLDGTIVDIIDNSPPEAADPTKQVHATFEIIPYIRDDEFSHHLIDTLQ